MSDLEDKTRSELKAAFVAGFRHSGEGYNGEFTREGTPDPWDDEITEYPALHTGFEEWVQAREKPHYEPLRELVEEWREKAREIDHEEYGYVCTGRKHPKAYQLQECADELEGLLDE